MKRKIQTAMILAALICMSLSGCNESVTEPTSTSVTYPMVKSSVTSVTTEVPVTEVSEKSAIPSTVVETTTDAVEVVAVTTVTAPQTETPKVEVEIPEFYEKTEPTEFITTPPVIADDTKLIHEQFSTEENMQRLTSELNVHYEKTGMTLDPTLNKHNTGWMFTYQGEIDKTAVRSYNEHWDRIVVGMDEQIEAFMVKSGATYTDLKFYYYAELQPDNEYHIYFCYQ